MQALVKKKLKQNLFASLEINEGEVTAELFMKVFFQVSKTIFPKGLYRAVSVLKGKCAGETHAHESC